MVQLRVFVLVFSSCKREAYVTTTDFPIGGLFLIGSFSIAQKQAVGPIGFGGITYYRFPYTIRFNSPRLQCVYHHG